MSNGTSSEKGEQTPAPQESEPDSLEVIDKAMRLAARDLRIAASFDPKLIRLLERADALDRARELIGDKLDGVVTIDDLPEGEITVPRILGEKALNNTNSSL